MTDDPPTAPARPWKRWAAIAVLVVVVWVLYPQLKDLGGELYRFFS
jgi:hypothetical protein